jgi:AP2 domain/HNH endonuclease
MQKNEYILTHEKLIAILDYRPETGEFIWKYRDEKNEQINVRFAGKSAGYKNQNGYIYVTMENRQYKAHRLAFLYVTKSWPINDIDHINGVKDDNRFVNLREASRAENNQNKRIRIDNCSGYMGVSWRPKINKWRSQIKTNGKTVSLGNFASPIEAHKAYLSAKEIYHKFQPIPRVSI